MTQPHATMTPVRSMTGVTAHHLDSGSAPAMELRDLTVNYGRKRAVDGLSLVVPQGSIYGFLGPNGAGKTTTIKTLLGFRRPDGGSARLLGLDCVQDSVALRSRIGYVSEVGGLYDGLTVPQTGNFFRSTTRRWDPATFQRFVAQFGLPTHSRVRGFSKGMKMQLAFALAMGSQPELLILDEPTSGLDPVARHELLNSLVSQVAAEGRTVFFSSHNLSEVEAVADMVGIVKAGRMVVTGDLDELKASRKAVRLVYGEVPGAAQLSVLAALPGVLRVDQEGRSLRLSVQGDVDTLAHELKALAGPELRDLDVVNQNLEDIFLELMKEERA